MASPVLIKNRYQIKDVLGRGGMGVVYQAYDTLMRREVAVKTLRDIATSVFVDLFYRECTVLTAMVHPNIVEIFDMGEFEEEGVLKPYFVMPLLPGCTLYDLIYPSGTPLPVDRCTDIVSQACRGLHAAHECGLLHRDIKPRNIFVMRDDAVKLIDFGVVRLLGSQTIGSAGTLGTLQYMAPEQISMKPLTARSDIFSLATVCYEALTGVHPFARNSEAETAAAVAEHTPSLVCALNPLVNRPLAQAVAQAMAKDPRNRFESAAAFADALQRGLRNERPGVTPLTNPQNRLARAQRNFARGDYEFAQEILAQLEAEGVDGPEIAELRSQLAEAVRNKQSGVLLTTARRYFDEQEYLLALRRVAEVLQSVPSHPEALAFKSEIEDKVNEIQANDLLTRAAGHLDTGAFTEAKRHIQDALEVQPQNAQAQRLLREVDERVVDWPIQRQKQEELFQLAQTAYFDGRFDTSLRSLQQLAEMTSASKAAGARVNEYQDFYKRVRSDYDALQSMLADARKLLSNNDLDGAFILSGRLREQCPQDPAVAALGKDIAARREAREQEYRRGILSRVESEPDLSARLHILTQAVRARPTDEYFQQERQKLQTLLQQITELVQRAQVYEASGQFEYALEEWLCVGDLQPAYPGLQDQLARVKEAWETARAAGKAQLRSMVTDALTQGNQSHAEELLRAAKADFDGDPDFTEVQELAQKSAQAHKEVAALLGRVQKAESERRLVDIPASCHAIVPLCRNIEPLRANAFDFLAAAAVRVAGFNWRVAEQISQAVAQLGIVPAALREKIARQEREEEVNGVLGEERNGQGNLEAYRERVAATHARYPDEARIEERLRLIDAALLDQRLLDEKRSCTAELALMCQELAGANDHRRLWDTYIRAKGLAASYADDHTIAAHLDAIREQSAQFEEAANALTRDRIKDCFAICDSMIARYPGHVLFQKLRDQATNRHHQLGEEYLARVERWLMSEPDVYQRELILLRAQEEYPFETRYADELRHLQREKALAESLAAKARDLEKRGQVPEALAQWRQLRNLHATYPGLNEDISRCESIIDRAQRKVRAQHLLSQGESHLAAGEFEQGYQAIREASELSGEIPELLRYAAPQLAAAARSALPAGPKLAEAMVDLAQRLDEGLRVPKEMRAKITEARKAEDTADCLKTIQAFHREGDLDGALAAADTLLANFPRVKQVESIRVQLLAEIEQQRKQQARAQTLDDFRQMELNAADMGPTELLSSRRHVLEISRANPGDEEINQRAGTLDALFTALAEVRGLLQAHALSKVEDACTRAFATFPDHPLFKAALAEAEKQKAAAAAEDIDEVKRRVVAENDLQNRAAILRAALLRFPDDRFLLDQTSEVNAGLAKLNSRIEVAKNKEVEHSLVDAGLEWENIAKDYPWLTDPSPAEEMERLSDLRKKEKQDALDRWFSQVEAAIDNCDYDTASTMLRQAAQQQSGRDLKTLEEKLAEGLKNKQQSDAKLSEGRALFADGDVVEGAKAIFRAFELQPKDQQKANAIGLLFVEQIRAKMNSDIALCETLVSYLKNVRADHFLPPDLKEAFAKQLRENQTEREHVCEALDQLADLARAADNAGSKRALSKVGKKLQASRLLDSRDVDVRRTAAELLRKVNLSLSGFETPRQAGNRAAAPKGNGIFSLGVIVTAAILLLSVAGLIFFLSRPSSHVVVPVLVVVAPDQTNVELDGQTCLSPDCKFSLPPGDYTVKLRKPGYEPKDVPIKVTYNDSAPINVTAALEPAHIQDNGRALPLMPKVSGNPPAALAKIQIQGALPHTRVSLDGEDFGEVAPDGAFTADVPPGPHTLALSLEGFRNRTITRNFVRGESFSLAKESVQLKPQQHPIRR